MAFVLSGMDLHLEVSGVSGGSACEVGGGGSAFEVSGVGGFYMSSRPVQSGKVPRVLPLRFAFHGACWV